MSGKAGKLITAPLPAGIDGHFGPALRRLVSAPSPRGSARLKSGFMARRFASVPRRVAECLLFYEVKGLFTTVINRCLIYLSEGALLGAACTGP
jgi:hypothetical protein